MPFKSQAQRRFFHAAAARGEIPRSTVKRWQKETTQKLPEKLMNKNAAFAAGIETALEKEGMSSRKAMNLAVKELPKAAPMGLIGGSSRRKGRVQSILGSARSRLGTTRSTYGSSHATT